MERMPHDWYTFWFFCVGLPCRIQGTVVVAMLWFPAMSYSQPEYCEPTDDDSINYLLCFVLEPCRLYLGYAGNLGEKVRVGVSM